MSYITTVTGKHFDPMTPEKQDIDIFDIAHALSLICRGNGHTKAFYSVAQHSLACAREAHLRGETVTVTLGCLLHDASEAYLSDVTRPVKKDLPQYLQAEEKLQNEIWRGFTGRALTGDEKRLIFEIDDCMLSMEFHRLMPEDLNDSYQKLLNPVSCETRPPRETADEFLLFFVNLFDSFSVHKADGEELTAAVELFHLLPDLPADAGELWVLERGDELAGFGFFNEKTGVPEFRYSDEENRRIYHTFLKSALMTAPEALTNEFTGLSDCDGKAAALLTVQNELFYGTANYLVPEYCYHEFGVEKEAVQIGMYVFYPEDISSIRKWQISNSLIK